MRKGTIRRIMTTLSAGVLASFLWASDDYLVSIYLMDADLITAIKAIAQQANAEVVFEPTDVPYKRINLVKLDKKPFEEALGYICKSAGATYRKEANGVYVISPLRPEPVQEKSAPAPTPAPQETHAPAPVVVERIPLRYSRASDIVNIIQGELQSPAPFADLREFVTQSLQHSMQGAYPQVPPAVPLRLDGTTVPYNSAIPTAPNIGSTPQPSAPALPQPEGEGQAIGGRGRGFGGQFGGFGQPGGFGGQPGGFGGQPGGFGGQPGAAASILQPPEGLDGIVANDIDNSIIVRGRPEAILYIRRILRFLDVAPRQVIIRAEFVTVNRNDIDLFGIDWNLARVNLTAGATGFASQQAPVFVNYATGNVAARLRSQISRSRGRVVNAPIVTTQNNMPAIVLFFTQDYIIQQTVVFNAQGQPTIISNPLPVTIPTQLAVTPRINFDNTITLALNPTITTTDRVRVGNLDLPRFSSQSVFTVRRIKNGETIVLGGLVSRQDSVTVNKVPILGDLPVLGQFFRSKDRNIVENELLIFVTATIVEEDEESAVGGITP